MKNIRFTAYCPIRFTIRDVHPSNLGPASLSNALYDMALLPGFGSVYSWAYWSMYAQRSPGLFACGWCWIVEVPKTIWCHRKLMQYPHQHLSDIFVDVRCCHLNAVIQKWLLLSSSNKIVQSRARVVARVENTFFYN